MEYFGYSKMEKSRRVAVVCVCESDDGIYMFDRDTLRLSYLSISVDRPCKWDSYRVAPTEIVTRLQQIYEAGPLRTEEGWTEMTREQRNHACYVNHDALRSLESMLFAPSGISCLPATSSLDLHNILLDGRPVLLRNAVRRKQRGRVEKPHTSCLTNVARIIDGRDRPFDASDGIDFLLSAVRLRNDTGSELQGCFVFPRNVLLEKNIVSTGAFLGVQTLSVFPPDTTLTSRSRRRTLLAQEWQLPYYVDLRGDEASLVQSRAKFKQILRSRDQ